MVVAIRRFTYYPSDQNVTLVTLPVSLGKGKSSKSWQQPMAPARWPG